MKIYTSLCTSTLFLTLAASQTYASETEEPSSEWGVSGAVILTPAPYKDYDNDVMALPLVSYEGDRLFWRGLGGGYYLLKDEKHKLSLNAYYMGLAFDPDDTGVQAMKHLDKRRSTLIAGVGYSYNDSWGTIRTEVSADALGNSNSVLAEVAYLYNFKRGKATITPGLGVLWSNSSHNNYYYGISNQEASRSGLTHYNADDTVSSYLELSLAYQFNKNWHAFFNGRVTYLGSEIKDSPMVDQSYSPMLITGMHYSF